MNFLAKYYDKLALGGMLVILALLMVMQTCSLQKARDEVRIDDKTLTDVIRGKPSITPLEPSAFDVEVTADDSRSWKPWFGEGSLMDPPKYVYARDGSPYLLHYSTKINPFTGADDIGDGTGTQTGSGQEEPPKPKAGDTDGDGIPDDAEAKYGLNPSDPRDARMDIDGDGFSNIEEYTAGTMLNRASHRPPLASLLRFWEELTQPLPIVLKTITALDSQDITSWEISVKVKEEHRGRVRWRDILDLRVGAAVPGTPYRVVNARYIASRDAYEIDIQQGQEQPITLPEDVQVPGTDVVYRFAYIVRRPFTDVRLTPNQRFALPDLQGGREPYVLLVSDDGLFAQRLTDGTTVPLKRLTRSDATRILARPMGGMVPRSPRTPGVLPGRPGTDYPLD